MAKKIDIIEMSENSSTMENQNEIKTTELKPQTRNSNQRFERNDRMTKNRSVEIINYLNQNFMNFYKSRFISMAHLIFRNVNNINDVKIVISDDLFVQKSCDILRSISLLEQEQKQKINPRSALESKKVFELLEDIEVLKKEMLEKLEGIQAELKKKTSEK